MKKYTADIGKIGDGSANANADLVKRATDAVALSQATSFESQLCRTLLKTDADAKQTGVRKYLVLYASVSQTAVLDQIWTESQKFKA